MLRHDEVLFADLLEIRDAKWKNEEKNRDVSTLFLFLPLVNKRQISAYFNNYLVHTVCIHFDLYTGCFSGV